MKAPSSFSKNRDQWCSRVYRSKPARSCDQAHRTVSVSLCALRRPDVEKLRKAATKHGLFVESRVWRLRTILMFDSWGVLSKLIVKKTNAHKKRRGNYSRACQHEKKTEGGGGGGNGQDSRNWTKRTQIFLDSWGKEERYIPDGRKNCNSIFKFSTKNNNSMKSRY